MVKRSLVIPIVLFAFGAITAHKANAATVTFDFAGLAANPIAGVGGGEGFWNTQITAAGDIWTVNGIGVKASGTGNVNSGAYLDGPTGMPASAGLGVCSTSGGCAGNNDDNVGRAGDVSGGALETLTLTFTKPVKLTDLFFKDENHNVFANHQLKINGITFTTSASGELTALALAALSPGTIFNFTSLSGDDNRLAKDFYLSEAIVTAPLPGALSLFATGLGALGLLGWRRKQKAATAA